MASRKDDRIKAVGVQFGQIVHLHHALTVAESCRLHHHVPAERERFAIRWSRHVNYSLDAISKITMIHIQKPLVNMMFSW